jgi:hypothetical protein
MTKKYTCYPRPIHDRKLEQFDHCENEDEDEGDEEEDEQKIYDAYNKDAKSKWNGKPASQFPDHKWIISEQGWEAYINLGEQADYRDPDNFDMYIYNDFYGYGIQEVIENWFVEFDKRFRAKESKKRVVDLWHHMHPVFLWLTNYSIEPWMHIDDGMRVHDTFTLIGKALLTTLCELDKAQMLGETSELKDIPLVIGLAAQFCVRYGAEDLHEDDEDEEDLSIGPMLLLRFAKAKGVPLETSPAFNVIKTLSGPVGELLNELSEEFKEKDNERIGSFLWEEGFEEFQQQYRTGPKKTVGGTHYSIIHFSRAERKEMNFHNVDPLAGLDHETLKQLKAGKICMQIR